MNHITASLIQEWQTLQNQFDSYEKHALWIKLLAIFIFSMAILSAKMSIDIVIVMAVLWLQDAIWKTFQYRIEPRLLAVEKQLSEPNPTDDFFAVCQFNRSYLKNKRSLIGMLKEYLSQAVRPTIAYPYVVFIGLGLWILYV